MQTGEFRKVALRAALDAGKHIKRHIGKAGNVRYKGEINIVTDIDRKSEDIIVDTIRRKYPRHDFLAEEKKYSSKGLGFTWIIDPLDGTTNFLHAFPFFCVSIGLAYEGEIITGVVFDPVREEVFWAEKGKGAFLNRKKIRVSSVREIKKSLLATGFAYNVNRVRNNNFNNFLRFMKLSQAVRRAGSAALDMCYVACGRFEGFWELYLHPWDTAASVLIVTEAGGRVTKLDGGKYDIFDKEILAANPRVHPRMVKILSGPQA